MSVISLYVLLPKNSCFVTKKYLCQYFLIFGQLHIELYFLVIYGQLIEGWGLVQILTENKFSMIGPSPAVDVNSIKRARYSLEITLCAIFIKLCEATSVSEADLLSYDWLTEKPKDNTSFLCWECVTDLQIKVLMYIRSICEANLKLHVKVL